MAKSINLESLQFWFKFCMYAAPALQILAIICGLGYIYADNKLKEIKEEVTSVDYRVLFSFEKGQIGVVKADSIGSGVDKKFGLLIYTSALVNNCKDPLTIKDVFFEYEFENKTLSFTATPVKTKEISNKTTKRKSPALTLKNIKGDEFIFLDWINLSNEIGKAKVLNPGEVTTGSVIFFTDIEQISEFNKIKNARIRIVEYSGWETYQNIEIPKEVLNKILFVEKANLIFNW